MKEKPVGIEPEKDTKSGVSKLVEEAVEDSIERSWFINKEVNRLYSLSREQLNFCFTTLATAIYTELEEEIEKKRKKCKYCDENGKISPDCHTTIQNEFTDKILTLIAEKKKLLGKE